MHDAGIGGTSLGMVVLDLVGLGGLVSGLAGSTGELVAWCLSRRPMALSKGFTDNMWG